MADKLPRNFGAKFQSSFLISYVKITKFPWQRFWGKFWSQKRTTVGVIYHP